MLLLDSSPSLIMQKCVDISTYFTDLGQLIYFVADIKNSQFSPLEFSIFVNINHNFFCLDCLSGLFFFCYSLYTTIPVGCGVAEWVKIITGLFFDYSHNAYQIFKLRSKFLWVGWSVCLSGCLSVCEQKKIICLLCSK